MVKDALSLSSKSDSKSSIANRSFVGDSFVNHYTQLVKRSLRLVNLYVTTPYKVKLKRGCYGRPSRNFSWKTLEYQHIEHILTCKQLK